MTDNVVFYQHFERVGPSSHHFEFFEQVGVRAGHSVHVEGQSTHGFMGDEDDMVALRRMCHSRLKEQRSFTPATYKKPSVAQCGGKMRTKSPALSEKCCLIEMRD